MAKEKKIEIQDDEVVSMVVDCRTGDITDTFRYGDSYKKQTRENKKKILDYLSEQDKLVDFNKKKRFIKLYDDILEELNKYLTQPEFNFVIRLSKYVSYHDCCLNTNINGQGKYLTSADIAILFDMNEAYVRKLVAALIKKGVLGRHKTGCKDDPTKTINTITCNPYIFTRGNKVNDTIIALFRNSHWCTLSQGELGVEKRKFKRKFPYIGSTKPNHNKHPCIPTVTLIRNFVC